MRIIFIILVPCMALSVLLTLPAVSKETGKMPASVSTSRKPPGMVTQWKEGRKERAHSTGDVECPGIINAIESDPSGYTRHMG